MRGSYASWSFFESVNGPGSKQFNEAFQNVYGAHRVTNDPSEAAYTMVKLWAAVLERAGKIKNDRVRKALIGLRYDEPHGNIKGTQTCISASVP